MMDMLDWLASLLELGPVRFMAYGVGSAAMLAASVKLANSVAFDRSEPTQAEPARRPVAAPRQPGLRESSREAHGLAVGVIPELRDIWAVAFLRGGAEGVRDALVAAAFFDGGIVVDRLANTLALARDGHADLLLNDLYRRVAAARGARPAALRALGMRVAAAFEPALLQTLVRCGLWPTAETVTRSKRIVRLAGTCALASGVITLVLEGIFGSWLMVPAMLLVMVLVLAATAVAAHFVPSNHRGDAYLRWLRRAAAHRTRPRSNWISEDAALFQALNGGSALELDYLIGPPPLPSFWPFRTD